MGATEWDGIAYLVVLWEVGCEWAGILYSNMNILEEGGDGSGRIIFFVR